MAWAWTSAPELLASLVRPASPAEARAEAEAAAGYACQKHENRCDQRDDGREAERDADPVGNRGKNDGNENSDHFPLLRVVRKLFPRSRRSETRLVAR